MTVAELKAANPQSIRANDWLNVGEVINIPDSIEKSDDSDVDDAEEQIHTVGGGESWNSIAALYDVAVADLMAANPQAMRAGEVLHRGDELVIPAPITEATEEMRRGEPPMAEDDAEEATVDEQAEEPADGETATEDVTEDATEDGAEGEVDVETADEEAAVQEEQPQTYIVQPGESWNSIARKLDVDPDDLLAANAETVRPGQVLFTGDLLIVPAAGDEAAADDEDTGAEDVEGALAEGTPADEEAVTVEAPACPAAFRDYPQAMADVLNSTAGGPDGLSAWLAECGAQSDEAILRQDWTGDGLDDLLVVYANPIPDDSLQTTDLIIFNAIDAGSETPGYEAMYRARAAGDISVLTTEDINADGQTDIVWLDTTCGASTCFDTVNVRSWDGSSWTDWTDGTITMAYATVDLGDVSEEGQGSELVVSGGVYGSVGAGPQRSRTEIWASIDGDSYTLIDLTFSPSECLYDTVMDGNRALLNAEEEGFGAAEAFFTDAIGNNNLIKCWVRDNELDELRTFSYFRLAQIAAYQDLPEVAGDLVGALQELYPDSAYAGLAQDWLEAYQSQGLSNACAVAIAYAEENPETWEMLADYGYTNPTFSAAEVCPGLGLDEAEAADEAVVAGDIEEAPAAETATEEPGEAAAEPTAAESTVAEPETTPENEGAVDEGAADTGAADEPADEPADGAVESAESGAIAPVDATLPECPPNVDRFARILPDLLTAKEGDTAAVTAWLESCEATGGATEVVVAVDLNEDDIDDIVVFPTIISDLGFGPGGSQGSMLIYHGAADGSYELVYEPEIYGQPTFLAAEDLNQDGQIELAWAVESCANFCVTEVQMAAWNGDEYVSAIEPGATIAEGAARFEPVGKNAAGAGQELILEGGVSGQPDGGLATPHAEVWQSIAGAPYERIEWTYDRQAEGNDCLGLRLVEGDMAMQAADAVGYGPAIDLYSQALDPTLLACSLYGMPGDDELILLQGLASFRLMQAQALDGDSIAARATLLALQSGQPEGAYTQAATEWLDSFTATGNAATACSRISRIFTENEDLWKITDHFGYNHPALPAQQICFVPE